MKKGKISKINKRAGGNKAVQVGIFQKINKLCSTFITYSRELILLKKCMTSGNLREVEEEFGSPTGKNQKPFLTVRATC